MDYAVQTFKLTKVFSDWWGRDKVRAVDELDLSVKYNEVYGLLGPNGSGKTTTIKMLLGLLHPTKGKALCLGGDSTQQKISSRIGFLPEESYLYKYLNARETLNFYGNLFSLPAKVRKLRTDALLDMVGLTAVANRAIGTYSKGMARRIGLAQALINDPDLLILDEPTTGLDPIGTRQIKDLIIHLAKRGKTILLCSHLLADVEDVCDRIAILYGGKIQTQGQVRELLQQSDKRQIVTGSISESAVKQIQDIVEVQEHSDFEVTTPMEKLESFFIKTVTAAEQDKTPTSGAVSSTQIGDFLTGEVAENILDKLVSSDTAKSETSVSDAKTDKVEKSEPQPDEILLEQLAHQSEQVETESVNEPHQDQAKPVEEPEVKEDILRQLTNPREDEQKPQDENKDSQEG